MLGVIVWIIVLWVIINNVKKNQKVEKGAPSQQNVPQRSQSAPSQQNVAQRKPATYTSNSSSQEELKQRLSQKYGSGKHAQKKQTTVNVQSASKPQTDILARAAANVSEDFEEKPEKTVATEEIVKDLVNKKMEGMTQTQIVEEADAIAEIDLYKVFDIPQVQQDSELMKTVSNLMAKGVSTEVPFQRDFVAEGMEMINSMTL